MERIITIDVVNAIAPEHGRTSCSDEDRANAYGGWNGKYNPDTGKKQISYPRCIRCFLLEHLGEDLNDLEFELSVCLEYKDNR